MDLSQKLKQARLAAGLSQKALCGDRITRNMLSQIENGSARPSMDTLRYLAGQLRKPLSYFLEEDAVTSLNQALMEQIREAEPSQALRLLGQYKAPDPTFDRERWLLEALICITLAEDALQQSKPAYAQTLLERAAVAGSRTPYYTLDAERRRLLLAYQAGMADIAPQLPDLTPELLLRADAALQAQDFSRCAALLACVTEKTPRYHYIKAGMHFAQAAYADARPHYEAAWDHNPKFCCRRLEDCCREAGDFAGAYFYACKLRELEGNFTKN
jgi:transcriptional regulator with XRE-family HTH domain